MMTFVRMIRKPTPGELSELAASLEFDGSIHAPFIVLTLASCAIATFGLIANSPAVVIGAMIIAPLMAPMTTLGYGMVNGVARFVRRSIITLVAGIVLALALSALIAAVTGLPSYGSEILARSQPTILDLGVALAAGVVAGYARVRKEIGATLAGTAIAVALMPPLCTAGIAIAHVDARLALGASLLFVSNFFGITFACMITYAVLGLVEWRRARNSFIGAMVLVVIVSIPLLAQFGRLLNQARLEETLRSALVNGTVTFQRVSLLSAKFDWLTSPPTVNLVVRSQTKITPTQVRLLEAYAREKTGQPFTFIFHVTREERVTDLPTVAPSPTSTPMSGATSTPVSTP